MKIEISEYEKKYSFDLAPITQLCGQNVRKKNYIFESLRRYFSTYKYREEENKWRDNLTIDEKIVGRKYFTVLSVGNIADILTMIKWSKQSLMLEYVKQLMQKFDWQLHLRTINEELEKMFLMMNADIKQLGEIELTYALADVWDMVQKSDIAGSNEILLEEKDNYELLMIFLNLVEKVIAINPKKMLVLIENIDHLLLSEEYQQILDKLRQISREYDIYFILSTSLDGYVSCDKELCSGVKVFGEVDFQLPELEDILNYLNNNYPCHKILSEEKLAKILESIIQKIGQEKFLTSVEESVVCKLLNQTLLLKEKWSGNENLLEISFLKA